MKNIFQTIGFILYLISGLIGWSWYVDWLDIYFLWEPIAILVSFLGLPFFFIFVAIEWVWHDFPEDMKLAMLLWLISLVILFVGSLFKDSDDQETEIDYKKIGGWLWIPLSILFLNWLSATAVFVMSLSRYGNEITKNDPLVFGSFFLLLSVLGYKFFKKEKSAPLWMIIFFLGVGIRSFLGIFIEGSNTAIILFITSLLIAWCFYFWKSERVNKTFINKDFNFSNPILGALLIIAIFALTLLTNVQPQDEKRDITVDDLYKQVEKTKDPELKNQTKKEIEKAVQKKETPNINNLECRNEMVLSLDKSECINVPLNAYPVNNRTDVWLCVDGYKEVGNSCVKLESDKNTISSIQIINPTTNPFTTLDEVVEIKGIVPNNTKSVVINGFKLQKFQLGQLEFVYIASAKYGILKEGENQFNIVANLENDSELKRKVIINYQGKN